MLNLLELLKERKIVVSAVDGVLKVKAPKGAINAEVDGLLKRHKQELLEFLVRKSSQRADEDGAALVPVQRGESSITSFPQQRLWFVDQLEGGSAQYNIPAALRLRGRLDEDALQRALDTIVERHEVLRTTYRAENDAAMQVVQPFRPVQLTKIDLTSLDAAQAEERVQTLVREEGAATFDLSSDLMLRASLIRIGSEEYVLLFTMHHIASDGWSMNVLVKEFVTLYGVYTHGDANPLPPLPIQYADYAYWQRERLQGENLQKQVDYWKNRLAGIPQLHSLPLDKPRGARQNFIARKHTQLLERPLVDAIQALAREHDATLFMILQSAYALLLARWSGANDIVMAVPTAGRTSAAIEPLIGFFINTLVFRTELSANDTFHDVLARAKRDTLETYANQQIPFEMLVDELKPERALSYNPLAQIKFVLQNFSSGSEGTAFTLPGLEIEGVRGAEERIRFDLDLTASESPNGVHFNWSFKDELFELATIERMADAFRVMLEAIVARPDTKVHELPLMDEAARTAMLAQSRGEIVTTGRDVCVQSLFEAQAENTPANLAVNDLTYDALNAKANRLAHYLQEQGIERGTRVGLYVERSTEVLIGMLGILKAGATYVPFEPSNTAERLRHIIANGEIECVLTHSSLVDKLPVKGIDVVTLDDAAQDEEWFSEYPSTNPEIAVSLDDSAYVIYTSGSTGVPKGVEITHRGLIDYLTYASDRYYAAHLGGSLVVTSHGFDITVPSLYVPLLRGGRVELTQPGEELMELTAALTNEERAYLLRMTPMHLTGMLALLPKDKTCTQRHVFVIGGEAFPPSLAAELQSRFPNAQIFNHYGPTETVVGCSIYDVTTALRTENQKPATDNRSSARLPIGRAMANQELYVLNEALQLAPVGVAGELCIGGAGVARGYVNQPDVTDAKFIANPFGEGRIYRSGDLVRYLPTGDLEFMGRLDDQIKIRGFRIELGEIETALKTQDGVKDALVVATGEGENKTLVAYVVASPADEGSFVSTLKTRLKQALPEYMVPSAWCVLEAFPLNANGKIDRKALPAVDRKSGSEYVAPSNATEEKLAAIWSEILALKAPLSITANFFELGGHSLLATRVVSAVSHEFRKSMPVRTLFEFSTVQALAAHIDALSETEHRAIKPAPRNEALPLSFAQQRLWFVDQLEPDSPQYNIPIGLRLTGNLDRQALQTALDTLVARHEVLRTTYAENVQVIHPASPVVIDAHDLTQLTGDVREARVQELATTEARRIFKLDADLMLRVSLLTLAETEHVLLFTMHHIASDAWSLGIVVREFVTLYGAFHAGRPNPLAPLPIQYGDYAYWQRTNFQGEEQLAYWKQQLADAPPVHSLPLDRARPARQTFEGGRAVVSLGKDQLDRLNELARVHNASLFMVLQAAFALLVARWSNETDVVMGTPVAGRNHRDTENLIGFFLNTLVLRTRIADDQSFHDLIEQARETHLAAHQHAEMPFEAIVEALNPERSLVHTPIFQLLINMNNTGESNLSLPELDVQPLQQQDAHDSKYDITLYLKEHGAGLNCTWAYNSHLFRAESIELMTREFASLVDHLMRNPELPVLAHAWSERSSALWNEANVVPLQAEGVIHRRIEQQQPGAVALIGSTRTLTYGQLNAEANQLARVLRNVHGIVEGDRVAIYSERSEARIIAILGILKAGAVYVPLSQELPAKRLEYMATNAKSRVLLTDSSSAPAMAELSATIPTLLLDDAAFLAACAAQSTEPLATTVTADSPAHIIYTSGSTGNPKGVLGTHGATVNRADWMLGEFPFADGERASHITSMAFIRGIWELFTPLCAGVPLVLFDREVVKDASRFVPMLREQGITRVVTAPSLMRSLLDYLSETGETLDTLRYWFVSGEALSVDIARRVDRALPNTGIFNLYGSTEVLSDVLFTSVRGHEHTSSVPLGKAIDNVAVTIVDSRNNPVPNGVVGQLVVTGRCVALGYEGLEELTAQQFIDTPVGRGYRTGDLARVLPCGNVEYLGRIDHQTKIRGYRIEPGEIEAQINALDVVTHAAVTTRTIAGETRLLAYVVFDKSSCSLTNDAERVARVKRDLKAILPEFMIPSAFTVMAELPLTANGKVNRKALPEPDFTATIEFVEASTPTQAAIAAIWQEILKVDRVSVTADFFELGGHSLLATRVASAITQRLAKKVAVRNLFENNTVAALAAFVDGKNAQDVTRIPTVSREQLLPVSFAQQQLWFVDRLEGGSAQYIAPLALRLTGTLDRAALQSALDTIVARHEILRTTYVSRDASAVQVISPAAPVAIKQIDLTTLSKDEQESAVERAAIEEATTLFDLAAGPMLRVALLALNAEEHVLLFTLHHIATDGSSTGVLIREFAELYTARVEGRDANLPLLPIQFADFAHWQRTYLDGDVRERELGYWRKQLADIPALHNLPLDKPRPAVKSLAGDHIDFRLTPEMTRKLHDIARANDATLFMLLNAALSLLVSRWSNESDVVIGSPIAGRHQQETEALIGLFVNTLVFRTNLAGNPTFAELLAATRTTVLDAFAHQDVPFELLVQELNPRRDLSHTPIFQILFAMQNHDQVEDVKLPELTVSTVGGAGKPARVDLNLVGMESEHGLALSFVYATTLFERATIQRIAAGFESLLGAIIETPHERIAALPVAGSADRARIDEWNRTEKEFPRDLCIHQLFEAQAARTPDAVAVVWDDEELTYGELNEEANRVAHALVEKGITPDTLVGISAERSHDLVIGILGILKAGGAYLPLDPHYPEDRLEQMLEDSGVTIVLTQAEIWQSHAAIGERQVVLLDPAFRRVQLKKYPVTNLDPATLGLSPRNLAYCIYTSGSTGRPKGVLIEHEGLVNQLAFDIEEFALDGTAKMLHPMSISFDAATEHLFNTLCSGAELHLAEPTGELMKLASTKRITHMAFPTALMEAQPSASLPSLRWMSVGGDACSRRLVEEWAGRTRFYNQYGPTECTVTATVAQLSAGETVIPIGRVTPNKRAYVVDRNMNLCPIGVTGELLIGGAGLARGYLNRPELTTQKFIADPFSGIEGAKLYRTGDLVRQLADGRYDFAGRVDDQVKVRGFRIELGEIEAQLAHEPSVKDALVMVRGTGGDKRLVAYLVPTSPIDANALRKSLKQRLPDYMIPAAFVLLERFPMTANGKVDRNALPEPELQAADTYVAPRNEVERILCDIWQKLLKLERVGVEDNFFAIGGDSILSIQVVSRANQAGIGITTHHLFEHQTVAGLAAQATTAVRREFPQEAAEGSIVLLPIQQHFLNDIKTDKHHFNQSVLLTVPATLGASFVRNMANALYTRHDSLRLRFHEQNEQWTSSYEPLTEAMIDATCAVEQLPADPAEHAAFVTARCEHYQRSFDLTNGPLFRAVLFQGETSGRLFLVVHHIVVDGVSWRILLADIEQAYKQSEAGQPIQLEPKTSSFQQWGNALRDYAASDALQREKAYWLAQYEQPVAALPVDLETTHQPANRTTRKETIRLSAAETQALLKQCGHAYRTTVNELLLSGLYLGMRRWTNSTGLRIALEGHGREPLFEALDTTQTVGWFTTVFPLTLSSRSEQVDEVIKSVKEQYRALPHNGIGYGVLRYLANDDSFDGKPHPQLVFNYLGQFDQTLEEGSAFEGSRESSGSSHSLERNRLYQIGINGLVANGVLAFSLDYSEEQYHGETMAELARFIEEGLRSVVAHCTSIERGAFTPSDFPLADVSQERLDEWQRAYPSMTNLYPATAMQQGMAYHTLLDRSAYLTQFCPTFSGALDSTMFREAWNAVVARNDVFRTAFIGQETRLHQLVLAAAEMPWHEEDWRGFTEAEQREKFEAYRRADKIRGFDLATPPMQRVALFRLGDERYQMLWSHHHMLLDGWCKALINRDVMTTYVALMRGEAVNLPEPPDYEAYLRWLASRDRDESLGYWREHLQMIDAPTPLVVDRPANGAPVEHENHFTIFSDEESRRLDAFAKANHTTINTLVQLAWGYVLHRYSNEPHVLFGSVISGRPAEVPGIESMIGLFINTIPVRISFDERTRIGELLNIVQRGFQSAQDHGYLPLTDVQGCTRVPNGVSLFDSLLIFENYPTEVAGTEQQPGQAAPKGALRIEQVRTVDATNFKLSLAATFRHNLTLRFSYSVAEFAKETIERLLEHLAHTVRQIPNVVDIRDIELVTDAERALMASWNATEAPRVERFVNELFEEQAARTPNATAIVQDGETITYGELNRRANQLARYLAETGVEPGSIVGLCVERSIDELTGILAAWKAGAAYVPLDPGYPQDRLRHMLEDSGATVILSQSQLRRKVRLGRAEVVMLDDPEQWENHATENLPRNAADPATSIAYVIYTSGSTGLPKGVPNTHAALANLCAWHKRKFNPDANSTGGHLISISFDPSVYDVWPYLLAGGRIAIVSDEERADPMRLSARFEADRITHCIFPTALLEHLAHQDTPAERWRHLEAIIVGGDKLSGYLVPSGCTAKLVNHYGPTEAAVVATTFDVPADFAGAPPIGRPMDNVQLYVLSPELRQVPIGVVGELHIGGAGLATGYLNRPELTAERFIETGFGRLYKTGDLVRYLPDGNLEFVGRRDQQVKIRGFRVELGEIEAALLQHPDVTEAVVVAVGERPNQHLAAFVVGTAPVTELQDELREALPEHMVPSDIVVLAELPLTPNGKVDRKLLAQPRERARDLSTGAQPRNPLEQLIAGIWCKHLELPAVGIDDKFFELGGHSLGLMAVVADLKRNGVEISVRQAVENQTIRTLAASLAPSAPESVSAARETMVRLNDCSEGAPLFVAHPFGGKIDCYSELAKALGDVCPVYGIQAPFNFNHDFIFTDLQQLAALYVEGMKAIQPEGPYHLAGWSGGGTIAWAIASILQERGEQVDYLGLFDAPPPGVLNETHSDRENLLVAARYADDTIRTKMEHVVLSEDMDASIRMVAAVIVEDESVATMTRKELEIALRFGVNFARAFEQTRPLPLLIRGTTTLYLAQDETKKIIPADAVAALIGSPLRTVGIASDHAHLMTGRSLDALLADAREQLLPIYGHELAAV
ncbi:MAG TPA: amino acid adenylation domain-containing protein [Thermoanaerobaculia bacterium]